MMASIVLSGTPASAIFVAAVWLRSWSRHSTPDDFLSEADAVFTLSIGRSGFNGRAAPPFGVPSHPGKTKCFDVR